MDITSSRECVLKTFALEPVVLALSQNTIIIVNPSSSQI